MTKGLIEWASEQPGWVSDSLRRIAVATDHSLDEEELACIVANVKRGGGTTASESEQSPIGPAHLGSTIGDLRRTVIAQLGPVKNIDRLAADQRIRMAAEGITLVYGENGSGKSGYTRIAKRLCRSLSIDQLRRNIFAPESQEPMRVEVRYRIGDDDVATLDWDPTTAPPAALHQISVFDSHNARLYVDGDNRIAYLPRELAILEHHGEACQRMAQAFATEEKVLLARLKVPLPAGYTKDTTVSATLARLVPKTPSLPIEQDIRALAELSETDRAELTSLEVELASDPVAMAAIRRRAIAVLRRVAEVIGELRQALSDDVGKELAKAKREEREATAAEKLAAAAQFADEPITNVGGSEWRVLFEAARAFATAEANVPIQRLPETAGDLCMLCQEPLSEAGAARLSRFNDFVSGEASRRANLAREALKAILNELSNVKVPEVEVVAETLSGYSELDAGRQSISSKITSALADFASYRAALLDDTVTPGPAPVAEALTSTIAGELEKLNAEAADLEHVATHTVTLDIKRARLADLKDRAKLSLDIEAVLQRRRDVAESMVLSACIAQVGTRPVSAQITALRKQLVTEELERRITQEIGALDLSHLPFKVSDSSSGGQSLFSVGLQGAGKVKNNQILSEGEQRALALACFLAEIGGNDARYGIIVDDPVSSLDHVRLRRVAQRLVAEAKKGRQVIVFTHNLVFFNEMVSEAARAAAPLLRSVVRKTQAEGFGVIEENKEPWIADLNARISKLRERVNELKAVVDFDTDDYRRRVKDFYSDLRESWERAVEEVLLAKTVVRFVPDVMTGRLKEVEVTDEDYRNVFFAMKRASERSGHDMSAGRDIPQPKPDEMDADIRQLDDFRLDHKNRKKVVSQRREALESPPVGVLI